MLKDFASQKEVKILEGHLMSDHMHPNSFHKSKAVYDFVHQHRSKL